MNKQKVIFEDLGIIRYAKAWDYQNEIVDENLRIKSLNRRREEKTASAHGDATTSSEEPEPGRKLDTTNFLLFCEHPPVYTLGKSGHMENVLMSMAEMQQKEIDFFKTNRGGDITFHGLQQVVGYPILDLEKFTTDIGRYLRNLEEVIIQTIAEYGIRGERSPGETGVWIDAGSPGRERKICAMGIRCSRWVTMHGFALNVNTDLSYFTNIIPCGIVGKQVTSMEKETGMRINYEEVKAKIARHFAEVFDVELL